MLRAFLCVILVVCFFPANGRADSAQNIQHESQVTVESTSDKPWRKKKKEQKKKKKKSVSNSKKFKIMARNLLGRPHWSDRFLNILDSETPKIAIHPFKEDELPISLAQAQVYVDGFTKALIKEADGRYAVVGRKELGALVSDINQMGGRSDSINPLGELFDQARSDLLAVGALSLQGERILLSYKLVEVETGRIVSLSQKSFKRKNIAQEQTSGGLTLAGAAGKAAQALLRDVGSIGKVMIQGLRYQTSGVHSGFGRYFMGVLSDQFRFVAARGPHNINSLGITDFVVEEERFRGLQLQTGSVEEALMRTQKEDYILKGSYWVFDRVVEIRLTLSSANGSSFGWRGRVLKSDIPKDMELIPPPAPVEEGDNRTLGPIDLYLSSNKGKNPLFKIGELMILGVRTGSDAYLACFYLQADGTIFKILPNKFIPSPKMIGGFLQYIPASGMPFSFEMSPPRGVEAVKCFATDRDVSRDVKAQIGRNAFQALRIANERELTKIYRNLRNVVLSEATLIVTLE